MRKLFIVFLLFCFFGEGNTDTKSVENIAYSVDTLITVYFTDKECTGCITSNEDFPYDFAVDSNKDVYLIDAGLQNIRSVDSKGKTIWNQSTAPIQHSAIHIFKDKVYAFDGITIEIRSTKTGELENKFKLPLVRDSIFLGECTYFYESFLYVNYKCPEMNSVNAYSVLLFDIQNGKMVKRANCVNYGYAGADKDASTFWAIPDCPDCLKELHGISSINFEGQSSRYIIIGNPDKHPDNKADTRLFVFDKLSYKKLITDLNKYYSEPWGNKRFKFLSPAVAATTEAEYRAGKPYLLHFIIVKFHN